MDLTIPDERAAFAKVFERAIADNGGRELARRAEREPQAIYETIGELLEVLGVTDVQPLDSVDSTITAILLCRTAGKNVLPFPLPEWLAAQGLVDADAVALVDPDNPHIHHPQAVSRFATTTLEGVISRIAEPISQLAGTMSPFTAAVNLEPPFGEVARVPALLMTLEAAYILGALDSALTLTIEHVGSRVQFGQALKNFQSVSFRVTDMLVATSGLSELAFYTAWSQIARPESAMADALALRLATLETAQYVIQSAHQMHGALGFTDEHDLSLLNRHVQARLRLPMDVEATVDRLVQMIDAQGFDSLFSGVAGRSVSGGVAE